MEQRPSGLVGASRRLPRSLVLIMSSVAFPDSAPPRRLAIKATRPALNDLRFRGEADVLLVDDDEAAVCLGAYRLTRVECTPLDLASLARTFIDIRTGQARRNQARR